MNKVFLTLSFFMGLVVLASNYLVQFPIKYYGLEQLLTYGAFSYPIAFLITDLANRSYGKIAARKIVYFGFVIGISFTLFFSTNFDDLISVRIAIGSGSAFLVAQLLDVQVFDKLRKKLGMNEIAVRKKPKKFKDIYNALPIDLKKRVYNLKNYDQRRDNVYTHCKTRQPLHSDSAWFSEPAEMVFLAVERQAKTGGETTIYTLERLLNDLEKDHNARHSMSGNALIHFQLLLVIKLLMQ
mgnify:CR=1 FL=1